MLPLRTVVGNLVSTPISKVTSDLMRGVEGRVDSLGIIVALTL